jgi:hypothetical protein
VDCLPQLPFISLKSGFIGNSKNTFQDVIVMGKNTVAAKPFTQIESIKFSILICSYLIVAAFLDLKSL